MNELGNDRVTGRVNARADRARGAAKLHARADRRRRGRAARGPLRSRSRCARSRIDVRRDGRAARCAALRVWARRRRGPRPLHPAHRGRDRATRSSSSPSASVDADGRPRADDARSTLALRLRRRAPRRACASTLAGAEHGRARARAPTATPLRLGAGVGRRAPASASPGSARATRCASTTPGARSSSAPTAPTPGPTARRTCSTLGGIPQGDYAPVPWLQSSARLRALARDVRQRHALRARRPARACRRARARRPAARCTCSPTRRPPPACAATCALTGLPGAAARVGLRALEVARRLRAPGRRRGGLRRLPLARHPARRDRDRLAVGDAIQHLGAQPAPVPGLRRDGARGCARDGVRTVVWVTPWVNLESLDGQIPPDPGSRRLHREPAPNYARAREPGTSSATPTATPYVARWWMGTGSPVDFTRPRRRGVVARAGRGARSRSASRASRPTTARATTSPEDVRFADGTHRARRRPGRYGGALPARRCSARSTRSTGRARRALRAQRLERPAGDRAAVGRRPGVGLLVAADARRRARSRRRQRLLELVARRRRLPRPAPASSAARRSCCVRWAQFGCFTPLMQAHGRLEQEPWTYDRETLDALPRLRPAARDARPLHPRRGRDARRAAGCRSSARCSLLDPADPRGWSVADAFGFGPVALGRAGARGGRARARGVAAARRLDRVLVGRARCAAAREVVGAGAAGRDPGVGARGRDRRHLPGRARRAPGSATRPRRARRSTRRCGASRAAAAPRAPGRRDRRALAARALVGRPAVPT